MHKYHPLIKLLINIAVISLVLLFLKGKFTPVFYKINGFWQAESVNGEAFYMEFDGNTLNIYGQDERAKKFNVRYDAQYQKDSNGRIVLIQISADSDSKSLKEKLDKSTKVFSSMRFKKVGENVVTSFYNGENLMLYKLKRIE
ncbi:hypothetical protein BIT28_04695 [Photobacterium proteolyticum]|uniref:Uncharacterized protein n=1 Tax=Photobacterium proteolyticum TaxID=1903952 RepID=A0A1Q9GSG2_9GAMM|nr:hypothetical protein [Photobacterium proteolyticum]OLQ77651.1 hypothetical protein BIT28_04695 [Photobacterium proteolyticum]